MRSDIAVPRPADRGVRRTTQERDTTGRRRRARAGCRSARTPPIVDSVPAYVLPLARIVVVAAGRPARAGGPHWRPCPRPARRRPRSTMGSRAGSGSSAVWPGCRPAGPRCRGGIVGRRVRTRRGRPRVGWASTPACPEDASPLGVGVGVGVTRPGKVLLLDELVEGDRRRSTVSAPACRSPVVSASAQVSAKVSLRRVSSSVSHVRALDGAFSPSQADRGDSAGRPRRRRCGPPRRRAAA